jgi:hypothetical protein
MDKLNQHAVRLLIGDWLFEKKKQNQPVFAKN